MQGLSEQCSFSGSGFTGNHNEAFSPFYPVTQRRPSLPVNRVRIVKLRVRGQAEGRFAKLIMSIVHGTWYLSILSFAIVSRSYKIRFGVCSLAGAHVLHGKTDAKYSADSFRLRIAPPILLTRKPPGQWVWLVYSLLGYQYFRSRRAFHDSIGII